MLVVVTAAALLVVVVMMFVFMLVVVTAAALLVVVVMMFVLMLVVVTAAALLVVVVMMFVFMLVVVTAAALLVVVMMMFVLVLVAAGVMMSFLHSSDNYSCFDGVGDLVDLRDKFICKIAFYLEFFHGEVQHSRLNALELADSFLYFSAAVSAVQIRYRKVFFHKVTILSHMNGCSYV